LKRSTCCDEWHEVTIPFAANHFLGCLQNFFLYFYGMVFNLIAVLAVSAWKGQGLAVLFQGQTAVTMLLIANNAAQVWPGMSGCSARRARLQGSIWRCSTEQSVCCNVLVMYSQGILSSFFYKFADTILKKYSSTIATIFTAIMSFMLFGHELTTNFLLGVSIVFISMHQVGVSSKAQGLIGAPVWAWVPSVSASGTTIQRAIRGRAQHCQRTLQPA
jgi:hypothetical protein